MKKNIIPINKESGFTLLELIVVVIILGIVATISVNLMSRQSEVFTRVFNNSELLSNGKKAIEYLRKDLHGLSADNISTMAPANLVFSSIDGNTVSYTYSSSTLTRNGTTLAEYIQTSPFSYLNAVQNPTGSTADLVFIKVSLQLGNVGESILLQETIFLRN